MASIQLQWEQQPQRWGFRRGRHTRWFTSSHLHRGGQLSNRSRYLQAHVRVPEHPGHAGLVEGEGEGEAWGKTETLLGHHTVRPGRLLACSRSPFQLCVLRGVDVWTVLGLVQSEERPV